MSMLRFYVTDVARIQGLYKLRKSLTNWTVGKLCYIFSLKKPIPVLNSEALVFFYILHLVWHTLSVSDISPYEKNPFDFFCLCHFIDATKSFSDANIFRFPQRNLRTFFLLRRVTICELQVTNLFITVVCWICNDSFSSSPTESCCQKSRLDSDSSTASIISNVWKCFFFHQFKH